MNSPAVKAQKRMPIANFFSRSHLGNDSGAEQMKYES